jgi:uncharacterized membrane protein
MIALIVYPLLFKLAVAWYVTRKSVFAKFLTGLAFGGMIFNSYVIYQEISVWVFCPLCAICTIIIVTIFGLSIMIWNGDNSDPTWNPNSLK